MLGHCRVLSCLCFVDYYYIVAEKLMLVNTFYNIAIKLLYLIPHHIFSFARLDLAILSITSVRVQMLGRRLGHRRSHLAGGLLLSLIVA